MGLCSIFLQVFFFIVNNGFVEEEGGKICQMGQSKKST